MSTTQPTLTLNGQAYPLHWDFGAIYLLQESGRAAAFDELGGPKGFKASIDLLWSMLPDKARLSLPTDTPAALARALSDEKLDGEAIIDLLHAALSEGTGSTSEAKKKRYQALAFARIELGLVLPAPDILAMSPAEWAAHVDAYQLREARARAWEARLHGLKHKSGRALSAEDFLPRSNKADTRSPEALHAAFAAAFAPLQNQKPPTP